MQNTDFPNKFSPHPLYTHIGNQVLARRKKLSLKLETLSIHTNIPIPDIYRIELGQKPITVLELFNLSNSLSIPTSFFFTNYPENKNKQIERLIEAFVRIREDVDRLDILSLIEKKYKDLEDGKYDLV